MLITIPISLDSTCILKRNQSVDFNTPYIETKTHSNTSISVSSQLGIKPDSIFRYLKKFVGDHVGKGDILAEKKAFMGFKHVTSEFAGTIKEINHYQGEIVLSVTEDTKEKTMAYFKGEVAELSQTHIKLKVNSGKEFELKRASENFGGEVLYIKNPTVTLKAEEAKDKMLVIESLSDYMKSKTEALGIKGLITLKNGGETTSIPSAQIKNSLDLSKIFTLSLPYCVINKESSRIYFYS